jgi:hypothetical protein
MAKSGAVWGTAVFGGQSRRAGSGAESGALFRLTRSQLSPTLRTGNRLYLLGDKFLLVGLIG